MDIENRNDFWIQRESLPQYNLVGLTLAYCSSTQQKAVVATDSRDVQQNYAPSVSLEIKPTYWNEEKHPVFNISSKTYPIV